MNPAGLDRALRALGPYVEDVVLCGAWAWYVHRRCSGAATWLPREFTRDVDCVGRETLALRGSAPLRECLEAPGVVWAPRGGGISPVAPFALPALPSPHMGARPRRRAKTARGATTPLPCPRIGPAEPGRLPYRQASAPARGRLIGALHSPLPILR